MSVKILVPDIGDSEGVEVIEISVSAGDTIEPEQTIIVLESDKATIEVPAPQAGTVKDIVVKEGDTVAEGDVILTADVAAAAPHQDAPQVAAAPATSQQPALMEQLRVPDTGSEGSVEVIEVSIAVGDRIELEQSVIVLESDKASMEIPSTLAGIVKQVLVKEGAKVVEGDAIAVVECAADAPGQQITQPSTAATKPSTAASSPSTPLASSQPEAPPSQPARSTTNGDFLAQNISNRVHAGPAVRRLANELGVDLSQIKGSGPKHRILKEDVHAYVKRQLNKPTAAAISGSGLPQLPSIDFSKFGDIDKVPLSKIQKVSAKNLHRSWLHIPHVTQFDEADITDLEAFRKSEGPLLKEQGIKLTPLAFIVKACAYTLRAFPKFNSSLDTDTDHLIMKRYINIGIAVDTPNGLVVPVVKNADQKSLSEIAQAMQILSVKARDKKLSPADMQGGTFSISSLGGIGGTAFTPIVNWPEVSILGVSKSQTKPIFMAGEFQPRLILPLSLSYDHRVIDGADAARFTQYLANVLNDIRRILV